MAYVILRWLRAPTPEPGTIGRIARLRTRLVAGVTPAPATTRRQRLVALVLVAAIYFVIVAAHQLTPYVILAGVGALTLLDLLRPRWLVLLLAAIAGAYLAPRYGLISSNFGGLFSGGSPLQNASGSRGTYHAGGEALTAQIVHYLAAAMWLLALGAVVSRRKSARPRADPGTAGVQPIFDPGRPELRRRGDLSRLPVLRTVVRAADRRLAARAAAAEAAADPLAVDRGRLSRGAVRGSSGSLRSRLGRCLHPL